MRHLKKGRKFHRERNQRRALMRAMASSFFIYGKIRTGEQKAKELRPYIEKIITRAKKPTLANRRLLLSSFSPAVVKSIFQHSQFFISRSGGYARIIKLSARKSDGAKMAILELVK